MIGRLQTNKVNRATRVFDWVQTIHSAELARRLSASCAAHGKELPVLLQVNIGREPHKGEFPRGDPRPRPGGPRPPLAPPAGPDGHPPAGERPEDARPHFRAMRKLFAALRGEGFALDTLSMGMSADWEVAVEEGATMIRLGTLLFGPRSPARRGAGRRPRGGARPPSSRGRRAPSAASRAPCPMPRR